MDNYSIVYSNITSRTDGYELTNKLASRLIENPYYSVSQFVKKLKKDELQQLIEIGELIKKVNLSKSVEATDKAKEFILIACMLVQGEGLDISINEETIPIISSRFFAFLNLEYLSRMGMVTIDYNNMSFDPDMDSKTIARRVV